MRIFIYLLFGLLIWNHSPNAESKDHVIRFLWYGSQLKSHSSLVLSTGEYQWPDSILHMVYLDRSIKTDPVTMDTIEKFLSNNEYVTKKIDLTPGDPQGYVIQSSSGLKVFIAKGNRWILFDSLSKKLIDANCDSVVAQTLKHHNMDWR